MSTKSIGARALALLVGSALVLTGCATSTESSDPGAVSPTASISDRTFTWAYEQEFSHYNANTADGNSSANIVVLNPVLTGFWQFGPDGSLLPVTDFGTYQKTNDAPLTVKYSINPRAAWSDGKPIDCDDMVLAWLANSGATGAKGFSAASTSGYKDMNKPRCKAGEKDVTVTFRKPYADWASLFGTGVIMPAHIVAARGGLSKSLIDYADAPASTALTSAIEFYNKGWAFNAGELKKDVMPSSGPYLIDSWAARQSLTLKANPAWWGTPPKTGTIVIRYIGGPSQAQALENGEIQAMTPQPQVDIFKQLQALGNRVQLEVKDQYSFEHLDFNVKGQFQDKTLRAAFAKCVPRQQIVDNLVRPQNPKAKIQQSRFVFGFQPQYREFENSVGGEKYAAVDVEGAKKLLAGRTPTVRVGWRKDPGQLNKRRADTVSLLQASCGKAGFTVVDAGSGTFLQKEWPQGEFDVALFAWSGSPLVTGSNGIYTTGGGNNATGYSNPEVDRLTEQLSVEVNQDKQLAILRQIDTVLWNDLATVPLFAFPAILATSKNARGLVYNATQADLTWNAAVWSLE